MKSASRIGNVGDSRGPFSGNHRPSPVYFVLSPTPEELLNRCLHSSKRAHGSIVPVTLKKDRELRYFSCWFQTLVERGEVVALTGWARDVTEQFEIEKRLHQEQEFNRRLIANFPDLIAVLDLQARFTYISDQVRNILGRSPQEYLGGEFGVRAGPEDKAKIDEMFQRVIKGEVSRARLEFRAPHADGTWRVLLLTAGPLFDETGKISGVVTSTRDVTEQHEIERKLHQEQEFVRRLVECFPDLIVVLDSEGRFKFVSRTPKGCPRRVSRGVRWQAGWPANGVGGPCKALRHAPKHDLRSKGSGANRNPGPTRRWHVENPANHREALV